MKLLIASGNQHKIEEFGKMFQRSNGIFQLEKSYQETLIVNETGSSFEENAFLKAKAYYEKYQKPVMSCAGLADQK